MDIDTIRKHCLGFPHATENVQWGYDLCFKVDGKLFAVAPLEVAPVKLSFKCTPENFVELCERSGIIPAPYMARAQWVALESLSAIPDDELRELLSQSYGLVWERLPKKRREALAIATTTNQAKACSRCQKDSEARKQVEENPFWSTQMKTWPWVLLSLTLCVPVLALAQTTPAKDAPATAPATASVPADVSPSALERQFFAIVRNGDALQFLSYVPEDGVNLGRDAQLATRAEIEDQLTHRTGLYCKLFDSSCIQSSAKPDAQAKACSYRELLTQSEKVRTASTETLRNGVRQAILVAEVHNQKCSGPVLIDFIFNYQQGGWKLFSIP